MTSPVKTAIACALFGAVLAVWLGFLAGESKTQEHEVATLSGPVGSDAQVREMTRTVNTMPQVTWGLSMDLKRFGLRSPLAESVKAIGTIAAVDLPNLSGFSVGDSISIPLDGKLVVNGLIHYSSRKRGVVISGKLGGGHSGTFIFKRLQDGHFSGLVTLLDTRMAYEMETSEGQIVALKRQLSDVLCEGIPKEPETDAVAAPLQGPMADVVPPDFDSLPSAAGVLYLDFDGEEVTDPNWNGGATINAQPAVFGSRGLPITTDEIIDVCLRVAEDFAPYRVSVTTIKSRYENAAVGNRMRCIVTPTNDAAPGSGGVAYLKSYRAKFWRTYFEDDTPCWCFNDSNAAIMAMTISHEVGHTFNLTHDGYPTDTYYPGHGTGVRSWGPLMGAPFSKRITQWSRGEYPSANNLQDDLAVIAGTLEEANGAGNAMKADEAGAVIQTASPLSTLATIDQSGVIGMMDDVDVYSFKTKGGPISVSAELAVEPNLDVRLSLLRADGSVLIASSEMASALGATLSASLAAGQYYLKVHNVGYSSVDNPGYTTYGSIGAYRLAGSYVPLPEIPTIAVQPSPSSTVTEGQSLTLRVVALSNSPVTYKWKKGGTYLTGKTASSLTINPLNYTHSGSYTVEVLNPAGKVESDPALVVVEHKPVFQAPFLPAIQTAHSGTNVSMTVNCIATGTLSFQWQKDGVDISGNPTATSATLELPSINWFDGGAYSCVASNSIGSRASSFSKLVVTSGPVFTRQLPTTLAVPVGGTISIASPAVGTGKISYQWYRGSSIVPGATKSTLTLPKASESVHEGEPYYVVATNDEGTATSGSVNVDVQIPPTVVLLGPATFRSVAGASITLAVTAGGTGPLSYQWLLNGVPYANGLGSASLTLSSLHWTHRGNWNCVVTNAVGVAKSKTISVDLTSPAVILAQPKDSKLASGGSGSLKVVAGGTPKLKYQWYKDGNLLPKATSATLMFSKATTALNGSYTVKVTNPPLDEVGETSSAALVTVENAPKILAQPVTTFAPTGGSAVLNLTVDPNTSPPIRYRWYRGNVQLPEQTESSLTIVGASAAHAGNYRVTVLNDVGQAVSRTVSLVVQTPPAITVEPQDLHLYEYDKVTFKVAASGSASLTYAWKKDGQIIPGATASSYSIAKSLATHAGLYECEVRNKVGVANSRQAVLQLDTVPVPSLTDFSPKIASIGHRVRVIGTNLSWLNKVTLSGKDVPFTKVSNTEALLTVPTGSRTGQITLNTYGGLATSTSSIVITTGLTNDDFANARLLFGSAVTISGSSVGSTSEGTDPYTVAGKSVWFKWRCPVTGDYVINDSRTRYDHYLYCFSGTSPSNLITKDYAYRYFSSGWFFYFRDTFEFTGIKGADYYFYYEGVDYQPASQSEGAISTTLTLKSASPVAGEISPDLAEKAVDGAVAPNRVRMRSKFTFLQPDSHVLQWCASVDGGEPFATLTFDIGTRQITDSAGKLGQFTLGQSFQINTLYELEFVVDVVNRTWGAYFNGHWIVEDASVPVGVDLKGVLEIYPAWAHGVSEHPDESVLKIGDYVAVHESGVH